MISLDERLKEFEKIRKVCKEKVVNDQLEKPKSFLCILMELEHKYPNLRGACEILHDFYSGKNIEKDVINLALKEVDECK